MDTALRPSRFLFALMHRKEARKMAFFLFYSLPIIHYSLLGTLSGIKFLFGNPAGKYVIM